MKAKFIVFVVSLAAISTAVSTLRAQYPGAPQPYGGHSGYPPAMQAGGIPYARPLMGGYGTSVIPVNDGATRVSDEDFASSDEFDKCDSMGECKGGCGKCETCCESCYSIAFYGDFLYLRPRDAEVAFATVVDGLITQDSVPIQVSPIAVADLDHQPAFRAGFRWCLNECNAVGAEYTRYEASTNEHLARPVDPNDVIASLVSHPSTLSATRYWDVADADYDMQFDIIDLNYYALWWCDEITRAYAVAGVRYVELSQDFQASFTGLGFETVDTDVEFSGVGARLGLQFDRYLTCQWLVYARGYGSLIPGQFDASYQQESYPYGTEVDTGWKAGRMVSIWDLELGTSFVSKCGWYRFDVGYLFSAWTNVVQTDEWIAGVRRNQFIDMDSTMTFDGLVARAEIRF